MLNRGRFRLFADDPTEYSTRALELVGRSTVIDMLSLLTLDWPKLYGWQDAPATFGEAEYLKLKRSGVTVFHPAVDPQSGNPRAAALRWTARWNNLLGAHPSWFQRIDGTAELQRVREEAKIGVLVGFQNSDHFQSVEDVALFYSLGQRVSQLTYNAYNRLGAGCQEPRDTGLTEYGARIVGEMNRLGMVVDISHCSDRTSLDTLAVSRRPVLVTHSNCRALVSHPRCKSDAVIKQLAAQGGVMGITVIPAFVRQSQPARVEDVLAHFDHVTRLVGVEHVGLGSDADLDAIDPRTHQTRPRYVVRGLRHARRTFDITEGLLRRGYRDQQIELILGGNFRRALSAIWEQQQPAAPAVKTSGASAA
jgi:membrane dipeptidase